MIPAELDDHLFPSHDVALDLLALGPDLEGEDGLEEVDHTGVGVRVESLVQLTPSLAPAVVRQLDDASRFSSRHCGQAGVEDRR